MELGLAVAAWRYSWNVGITAAVIQFILPASRGKAARQVYDYGSLSPAWSGHRSLRPWLTTFSFVFLLAPPFGRFLIFLSRNRIPPLYFLTGYFQTRLRTRETRVVIDLGKKFSHCYERDNGTNRVRNTCIGQSRSFARGWKDWTSDIPCSREFLTTCLKQSGNIIGIR